jgi:hypothetical protein
MGTEQQVNLVYWFGFVMGVASMTVIPWCVGKVFDWFVDHGAVADE